MAAALKCPICKKDFSSLGFLKKHMREKTCINNISFTCENCNKVYTLYKSYWAHKKNVALKNRIM